MPWSVNEMEFDIDDVKRVKPDQITEIEVGDYVVAEPSSMPRADTVRRVTRVQINGFGNLVAELGKRENAILDRDMEDYTDLTEMED